MNNLLLYVEHALLIGGAAYMGWRCYKTTRAIRRLREERDAREKALQTANAELQRLARESASASQAKSDFLAMMSHELRTPLTAIIGYTEIMSMGIHGPVTEEQSKDYDRIMKASEHLLTLINTILDHAKIESGKVTVDLKPVLLRLKVEAAREMIEPLAAEKQIVFRVENHWPSSWVRGDGDALKQIVLNLLSNAVKFTGKGGEITLRTECLSDTLAFSVRDTGIGIPEHKVGAVFEPFMQVDTSFTRRYGGTGLGLSISRQLARAMKGDLVCESKEGVGSTFTLILPRDRTVEHESITGRSSGDYNRGAAAVPATA